ncbi:MAG: hypothetical protein HKN42_13970 [Granulosicoccus sp.]|nr:hypothetical protein [Granulosicoccus sp.]
MMHRHIETVNGVELLSRRFDRVPVNRYCTASVEPRLNAPPPEQAFKIPWLLRDTRQQRVPKGKPSRAKKSSKFKGRRGIDTLLRNAYRAQLDMLSLAAMKANIMISLNGILMSMLIISGAHFIGVDGWYAIPIAVFLVCCALATIFAVLAARPDISRKKYVLEDFNSDKAHLLVFEEFSDISEKHYVDAMTNMFGDNQRVYQSMIAHVHELGSTADRKYRSLYYSYTVFIGGIVLTVFSLMGLLALRWTGHLPPL